MLRTDPRPLTRRAVLFAYIGPLLRPLLPRCPVGARFTSIEGSDLAWLLRWCCGLAAGPRLAAA